MKFFNNSHPISLMRKNTEFQATLGDGGQKLDLDCLRCVYVILLKTDC